MALSPSHHGVDNRFGVPLGDLTQRRENVIELLVDALSEVILKVDIAILDGRSIRYGIPGGIVDTYHRKS